MSGKEREYALLKLVADAAAAFSLVALAAAWLIEAWWKPALLTYVAAVAAGSVIFLFAFSWLQIRCAKTLSARFPIVENRWFRTAVIAIVCSLAPLGDLLHRLLMG